MSHPAATAYYKSLVDLYASWGADFIKVDCIFSTNYHEQDIIAVSFLDLFFLLFCFSLGFPTQVL